MCIKFSPKVPKESDALSGLLGWVLTIIVAAALLTSGYAQVGPTEESLKVVHDTVISSVTKGNVPAVQAVMHPQALGFFRESQTPWSSIYL